MASEANQATSLYADGWRQGSIFRLDLTVRTFVLAPDGAPVVEHVTAGTWVVASQDCDLDAVTAHHNEPLIEVRPVEDDDGGGDWGIRSRKLRLNENQCVQASGVPARLSPSLLHQVGRGDRQASLSAARAAAFKTWLGLRFDRPAVPKDLVPLAKTIAEKVRRPGGREVAASVHDVLMQFDESRAPPRALLFAVVEPDADREAVRRWLAGVAQAVPTALGVVSGIDVGTKAETSIELLETSYAADASQITWRGPNPQGAP